MNKHNEKKKKIKTKAHKKTHRSIKVHTQKRHQHQHHYNTHIAHITQPEYFFYSQQPQQYRLTPFQVSALYIIKLKACLN